VPILCAPVLFAKTLYFVCPLPLPDEPDVIVIHAALLVDVQAQPVPAVMFTAALADAEVKVLLVGLIE
jgi:hypothetical protein